MVTIIADTTSCISVSEAQELGIPYIPQIIVIGEESYRDDTEIDSPTFLSKLRSSPTLPKTAAPPPALYSPIYQKLKDEGQTMIVIAPSANVSGTVRSATVAAQDFPDADIRVVDSQIIGTALGTLVRYANRWAKEGVDADTIIARLADLTARSRIYFVVDTLEYLYKGGRIGAAKALMGSILQVKPILAFHNSRIEAVESQRTKRRAMARLNEMIDAECPHSQDACFTIMHGDALVEAQALADQVADRFGITNIWITEVPPAIMVHAGPGVLAASFLTAPQA